MRGMRPFVAAIIHMTKKANLIHKAKATPSASFAVAMWRACAWLILMPYLYLYMRSYVTLRVKGMHLIVSDASPWRLCAALYHPVTGTLLA